MTCLITGCALYDPEHPKWVHGDLWVIGTSWVFNAVLTRQGEAAWNYEHLPAPERVRALVVSPGTRVVQWFERRGVVVLPQEAAQLNAAAAEYVIRRPA